MSIQNDAASQDANRPRATRLGIVARRRSAPALLFLTLVLLFPVAAGALEPGPADGSTLDTSHMTLAEKIQAHLEGDAVVSLVGLILCFAGGACLVVMVRRDFRFASRRAIRSEVELLAYSKVIPINSYRATTAALRSARLAEAAVSFGLAEPDEGGSSGPPETERLLDHLLEVSGQDGSPPRMPLVAVGGGRVVRYSPRFARLARRAYEERDECHDSGEVRLRWISS